MTEGPAGEPITGTPAGTNEPAPPASEGSFARLGGVLFSPDETFESIARKPDWLVPLLLFMALSLFSGYVFAHHVDFAAPAREQMEAQGKLTSDQIEAQSKVIGSIAKVAAYCSPVISVVMFVIVASLLMLAYRMMAGEGDFKQYFSVTLYAWLPQIIQALIMAIILLTRSELLSAADLPALVRSNLGFLVDMHEHKVLFSLLTSIDAFTIWSLVLMVIGFAHVSHFSKQKSASVLITLWAIWTGLKLSFVAIGAMMGPK
jgi:hypothetical protein